MHKKPKPSLVTIHTYLTLNHRNSTTRFIKERIMIVVRISNLCFIINMLLSKSFLSYPKILLSCVSWYFSICYQCFVLFWINANFAKIMSEDTITTHVTANFFSKFFFPGKILWKKSSPRKKQGSLLLVHTSDKIVT